MVTIFLQCRIISLILPSCAIMRFGEDECSIVVFRLRRAGSGI